MAMIRDYLVGLNILNDISRIRLNPQATREFYFTRNSLNFAYNRPNVSKRQRFLSKTGINTSKIAINYKQIKPLTRYY